MKKKSAVIILSLRFWIQINSENSPFGLVSTFKIPRINPLSLNDDIFSLILNNNKNLKDESFPSD